MGNCLQRAFKLFYCSELDSNSSLCEIKTRNGEAARTSAVATSPEGEHHHATKVQVDEAQLEMVDSSFPPLLLGTSYSESLQYEAEDDLDVGSTVTFSDSILVVEIPSRCDYCEDTKKNIWRGHREIAEMATRNAIEFRADGWDWRHATEDEMFVSDDKSSQVLHPVTFKLMQERGDRVFEELHAARQSLRNMRKRTRRDFTAAKKKQRVAAAPQRNEKVKERDWRFSRATAATCAWSFAFFVALQLIRY